MKKLLSILTVTSFSLVPTINIIACQNKAENDDEVVGETIAQEIVDGAIDEINEVFGEVEAGDVKVLFEDKFLVIKEVISDIEKNPEYLIMHWILIHFSNFIKEPGNDKSNIANLKLDLNVKPTDLTKQNFKKFKVISLDEKWFENVKKITDGNGKQYEFRLKFGKNLSKKTVKIKLFWNNEEGVK